MIKIIFCLIMGFSVLASADDWAHDANNTPRKTPTEGGTVAQGVVCTDCAAQDKEEATLTNVDNPPWTSTAGGTAVNKPDSDGVRGGK